MPAKPNRHRRVLTSICLVFTLLLVARTAANAWLDRKLDRRARVIDRVQGTPLAFLFNLNDRYEEWESRARDWLTTNPFAHRADPNPEIIFLGIDQSTMSLDALFDDDIAKSPALRLMKQGFPWDRGVYAHVADRLIEAGAAVVIFDILFPGLREGDEAFRAALERHAGKVVIGSNLVGRHQSADAAGLVGSRKTALEMPSATLLPEQARHDARIGFVNVWPDRDGIVRRITYRTTELEAAGKPAASDATELRSLVSRALEKSGRSGLIPATRQQVPIRFTNFDDGIFTRPLYEIFVEDMWNDATYRSGRIFRGKIVLIGAAGNQAEDRLATPFGTVLGPTIHLSALNAALNQDFLHLVRRAGDIGLTLGAGVLAWMLGAFFRQPLVRLGVLLATLTLYVLVAQHSFNGTGLLLTLVSPMLALAGPGFTWTAWEAVLDRIERTRMRRTLERYVSRDVVRELVDNPESFLNMLGGARKNITVMFSDVRGFTTRTEGADPHELVKQLNEYFDEMVRIAFANQGTLDKFIGDAVMAHWGSIVSEGEKTDACRAVKTAIEMRRALARLNDGWRARGIEPLAFGIGINHGEAIVGNLGCEAKMEVSVIGDAVNVASRLEGVTKSYRLDLVIGEKVEPLVRDEFVVRSVDLIKVKGKTRGVAVFTVLDEQGKGAPPAWLARHEEAMRHYRAGNFASAAEAWREVLAQAPGDGIAEVFLERCRELHSHPPEGAWDGVFEMKSK
jgi:adenylate cyclase